ncbi:MAG: MinD/ParA family ATP-binding protein, partial [Nanopusillaceae archaeon]
NSEEVIVITNYEKSALLDAYRLVRTLEKLDINILGIVINKVKKEKINFVVLERFFRKEILGIVHYDENVKISLDYGIPLIDYKKNSIAAIDVFRIAEKITGREYRYFEERKGLFNKFLGLFKWK